MKCALLKPYYSNERVTLYKGDSLKLLKKIGDESINLIFADPPYFLSNGGITCKSGKMASVNKGSWDKSNGLTDKHNFNRKWIKECYRILAPNGSIWICGTFHNIYSVGMALEENNFKILNNITWQKTNPPPNLSCRYFTHSTETVLWAKKNLMKSRHTFNYAIMKEENGGKQMKDVWVGTTTRKTEKIFGNHPTQKPIYLLERIIRASSNEGDLVLDPFCGSSTTGVAAIQNNRRYIGIDISKEYMILSRRNAKLSSLCVEISLRRL